MSVVKFNSQLGSLPNSRLLSDVLAQLLSTLENVMRKPLLDRLNEKTSITDTCHLWTATKSDGYGMLKVEGKMVGAHRLRYTLEKGEIPESMFVCHTCDVRACNNLDHLFLGTNQENMDDMKEKGRSPNNTGAKNPFSKLTERDIPKIRELHASGSTYVRIAEQFGVKKSIIGAIINKQRWAHV